MLNETIMNGLNNPECAFYVGSFLGGLLAVKWVIVALIFIYVSKVIDKLAFEPFLNWIKKKIYKK